MRPWLRLPLPLRLTIPALVLAFNVCFVAVTAYTIISRDNDREVVRVRENAAVQAARLAEAAFQHLGEDKSETQKEFFQHELSFVGTDPGIRWAVLASADQRVLFSAKNDLAGQSMKEVLSGDALRAVTRVLAGGGPEQSVKAGDAVVAAHPVAETAGLAGMAIVLEHDLSRPMASLRVNATEDLLLAFTLMLLACLGLWLALKGYLSGRARALVEGVRTGSIKLKPPLAGSDEFADISRVLRESEDRFRQVCTRIRDVFYMVDAGRSKILYVNPAYEEVWGRTVESLFESPGDLLQSVEETERDDVVRQHEPLYHGADSVRLEYRIRRPDGTIRWIENRAFPVLDDGGKIYCIAGLARDVTDRKYLERELMNAAENERKRIGRDLHDDLCQRLAAIRFKCEMLAEGIKRGEMPEVSKATELSRFVAEAAALCRAVARTLVPVDLAGEGLMVALDRLVKTVEALHEVPCFFYCPDTVMVESTNAAVHLYRIAQEFLNNAIRHGRPSRVDVRLEMNADFVRIEVVNDGQMFADPGPLSHGMGLKILHFRADAIGATLRIQPRMDGIPGTQATCLAPHASCNPDPPSKS